jgi:archaeosortase B (VPXXXP-CTERM-specific)
VGIGRKKRSRVARSERQQASGRNNSSRTLSPAVRFVVRFLVSLVVLGFLYSYLTATFDRYLMPLLEFTTAASGFAASALSGNVFWSGKLITYNGFTLEIIDECTGLLEMVIYMAAVISYLTTIRKKVLGIAFGLGTIYMLNIIRIVFLLIVGSFSAGLFRFMHLYFWQATLIIMIAAVWVAWLLLVVNREKRAVAVSG